MSNKFHSLQSVLNPPRKSHDLGQERSSGSFDKVPFGYAAITGGPGSGKTSLGEDLFVAFASGPARAAVVARVPVRVEEPTTPQHGSYA